MVMTVVQGHVAPESWAALEQAYEKAIARGLPPEMSQTFLLPSATEETLWQIFSILHSGEALEERQRQRPATLVSPFQAVGAEPTLHILDIVASSASEHRR
jgi:hypothetical protein